MKNYSDDKVLNELVCLKVQQAIEIMNEINLDVWLIPTQEMGDGGDTRFRQGILVIITYW